ncbi:biotin-dependent carboxyltransferase family protein [Bacillus marasmi]|uniref:5-oxoprolinase subunit C family protein n=1 Tax=Bacillus marasmi TaxID=1926279 RepID=UPI0011CB006A|nr:biotin-dependent carboxyltransferase family protein [Bacillus marasmi]
MLTILKPGLFTSIQDLGRYGFQKYGVIASGAMDQVAHRIANILVGNPENASTLEITLIGPKIKFNHDCLISICGGEAAPIIDGKRVKLWRPVFVKEGSVLEFGAIKLGCRAYIAIAGSFCIPVVLNSKSTYFRAKLGGYKGRSLQAGDRIPIDSPSELSQRIIERLTYRKSKNTFHEANWLINSALIPAYREHPTLRVMKGRQFHLFDKISQSRIFNSSFLITPQSDRMGYRLNGTSLMLKKPQEMISEAVSFGTIQVPADGNPIILLADRQTTGGYPKIAQIAAVDLPLVAQAKPGSTIRFIEIYQAQAQLLYLQRERQIAELKQGINLKYR